MTDAGKGKRVIKIALTGGGTAGHVVPHLAMLDNYQQKGWKTVYIGGKGIEMELMSDLVPYHKISVGKLRRYFSWQNFIDVFKVIAGTLKSIYLLAIEKPDIIFSKGGFVSVPVAFAGYLLRIPVVTHESDFSPGLATKIVQRFARRVVYAFPETVKYLQKDKSIHVGTPIRSDLFSGNRTRGVEYCGFDPNDNRKVVLFMGGSLGAQRLNETLAGALEVLTRSYRIIHLAGRGKKNIVDIPGSYIGFEYVKDELKDLFSLADLVVARAGANSIFEFLALQKPMLLIPLEVGSRGDQLHNAGAFDKMGWAKTLREKDLHVESLVNHIRQLDDGADAMVSKQSQAEMMESNTRLISVFESLLV